MQAKSAQDPRASPPTGGSIGVMAVHFTTQVLDSALGQPAEGLSLSLYRVDVSDGGPQLLQSAVINSRGGTDKPLLSGELIEPGVYVIEFEIGEYFEKSLGESPFLGTVPVMFKVTNPGADFHLPILCSPYAYSVQRGV